MDLPRLTESDRLAAREQARAYVIARHGRKPERDQFDEFQSAEYPRYITWVVTALALMLITAFGLLSAMRLYHIGSHTFEETIANSSSATAAGVTIVLGAETGAILFTLLAGVLAANLTREKRTFFTLAGICTTIAIVGNMEQALGSGWWNVLEQPFATIEAAAPPIIVLGGAYGIKRIWLDDIARHHANERAYQEALANWKQATANPEGEPDWNKMYATALREVYIERYGRRAQVKLLDRAQWSQVVHREMQADDWFQTPSEPIILPEPPVQEEDTQRSPLDQSLPLSNLVEPNSLART